MVLRAHPPVGEEGEKESSTLCHLTQTPTVFIPPSVPAIRVIAQDSAGCRRWCRKQPIACEFKEATADPFQHPILDQPLLHETIRMPLRS